MREPTKRELMIILDAVRHAHETIGVTTGYPSEDVMDKNMRLRKLFYDLNKSCIDLCKMIEKVKEE